MHYPKLRYCSLIILHIVTFVSSRIPPRARLDIPNGYCAAPSQFATPEDVVTRENAKFPVPIAVPGFDYDVAITSDANVFHNSVGVDPVTERVRLSNSSLSYEPSTI